MLLDLGPREKVAAVQNAAIWALGRSAHECHCMAR